MAMTNEHKTAIKNIRKAIKEAGFKASVSGYNACGDSVIKVCTPTFDRKFTSDQIAVFAKAALDMGLTHVMKSPFTVASESYMTGKNQFDYYL